MARKQDYIHFSNGFWKIGWDISKAFPPTVHNVVTTGTCSGTMQDTAGRSHKRLMTWNTEQIVASKTTEYYQIEVQLILIIFFSLPYKDQE